MLHPPPPPLTEPPRRSRLVLAASALAGASAVLLAASWWVPVATDLDQRLRLSGRDVFEGWLFVAVICVLVAAALLRWSPISEARGWFGINAAVLIGIGLVPLLGPIGVEVWPTGGSVVPLVAGLAATVAAIVGLVGCLVDRPGVQRVSWRPRGRALLSFVPLASLALAGLGASLWSRASAEHYRTVEEAPLLGQAGAVAFEAQGWDDGQDCLIVIDLSSAQRRSVDCRPHGYRPVEWLGWLPGGRLQRAEESTTVTFDLATGTREVATGRIDDPSAGVPPPPQIRASDGARLDCTGPDVVAVLPGGSRRVLASPIEGDGFAGCRWSDGGALVIFQGHDGRVLVVAADDPTSLRLVSNDSFDYAATDQDVLG